MKIISISTDRKIFEKGSAVRQRMIEYGQLSRELHIIIFSLACDGYVKEQICPNVWIYPTNSRNKFQCIGDAVFTGKKISGSSLVTAQDPFETGLAGFRISKFLSIPLHVQIHTDFLSPYFASHSILNRIRIYIAKFVLPRASRIRVVSERIRKSLALFKVSDSKIDVLPIFTDIAKIQNTPPTFDLKKKYPQFDFLILMLSRLEPEKNISLALDTLLIVKKNFSRIGMVIVGEGSQKAKLESLVESLGLKENVVFEPWKDDAFSCYKTADIFLSTSDYEGYGLTLIEAAILGCPIVCFDVGVVGFELPKDLVFLSENNAKLLAQKIIEARVSEDLRRRKSEWARIAILKSLSYDKRSYLGFYKKSLELSLKSQ